MIRLRSFTTIIVTFLMATFAIAKPIRWFEGNTPVSYICHTHMGNAAKIGISLFEQDMKDVTGLKAIAQDIKNTKTSGIHIYTLDNATGKQKKQLRKAGIDVDYLNTTTDAFQLKVCSKGEILIVGSNDRGTAYGILELSRKAGVNPWVWWGDVVPERKHVLTIDSDTDIKQKASVEMRGIFINDEDWSFRAWSNRQNNNNPELKGIISAKTYRKVFELLLRLRANTIWPAMHEGTRAFFQTPGAKAEADSCGIFIGTSHCEPLMRNNVGEWDVKERGRFNYITNRDGVQGYWAERLDEVKGTCNNIFTIGMRGIHDGSMEGVKTTEEKFNALQQVIDDQQILISKHIGDPAKQPQIFVPYKEVLELYEKGLKVPDYVTLMWCDDNYGYLTRLSTPEEQKRSGGAGVYYHLSYWGRPHDYLWLTTTQPGLIFSEMKTAYDHNARKLWIANVHDPKIAGYDLELFLDMAWDINSVKADAVGEHYRRWLSTQFGEEVGSKIYPAMREWIRLTAERKPEHMAWTQVELDKKIYERGLSKFTTTELSQTEFNELQHYLDTYDNVEKTILEAANLVRPELKDAYFARIIYPVSASAAHAHKILEAQKANEGDTNSAAKSIAAYEKIKQLTAEYNAMNGGKWNGLMDMNPRNLPVFASAQNLIDTTNVTKKDSTSLNLPYITSNDATCSNGQVVDMLGHSMKAIQVAKGETLSYPFSCKEESDAILRIALIPTQPNDNGDLRFAVSMDDGEETVFSLKEKFRSEGWKKNVMRQQALRELGVHLSAGAHLLKFRALDDHIILDQWMIDFNIDRPPFYLIP